MIVYPVMAFAAGPNFFKAETCCVIIVFRWKLELIHMDMMKEYPGNRPVRRRDPGGAARKDISFRKASA